MDRKTIKLYNEFCEASKNVSVFVYLIVIFHISVVHS